MNRDLNSSYPRQAPKIGSVAVFDDLVDDALRADILRLVRRPIWAYGWKSVKEHDRYGFWHAQFAGGDERSRHNCEDDLSRNLQAEPIHRLWNLLKGSLLRGHEPVRVYANAHTYGVEGYVHTDSDVNWAGETVFFCASTGDITHAVPPKPGRLVTFCGATPHVARSASRECPELRVSVVIKTTFSPLRNSETDSDAK